MRIAVTGAGGMLGRDVVEAAESRGLDVASCARGELDVTDRAAVERVMADFRPDAVINCAAYTDVDGAETHPEAALAVNGEGAGNVARAAASVGATVVLPSTDYVFAGDKTTPYLESDPTGPRSAYGRSKLAGERATEATGERHCIVRTAWLFGLGGRNFVDTMLRLGSERESLKVVSDQVGCPTATHQLAAALLDLAAADVLGTCHVAGAGRCSWAEFATEIFRRAGLETSVEPCSTEEFPRPAPRPAWSVLASERTDVPVLPDWRTGLGEYLERRAVPQ